MNAWRRLGGWTIAAVSAIGGLVVGLSRSMFGTSPFSMTEDLFRWIANNGFAVVIAILLLFLLRYVIFDAVGHFNTRLDTMMTDQGVSFRQLATEQGASFRQLATEQGASFRQLTAAITHLDSTLDRLGTQSAANHEALSNVMLFISHTQQEVVAHRVAMEDDQSAIPSPPFSPPKDPPHDPSC